MFFVKLYSILESENNYDFKDNLFLLIIVVVQAFQQYERPMSEKCYPMLVFSFINLAGMLVCMFTSYGHGLRFDASNYIFGVLNTFDIFRIMYKMSSERSIDYRSERIHQRQHG